MNNDDVVSVDQFKGKRVEFAPMDGIDMFADIADEFMEKIFGLAKEDYAISDESHLFDFIDLDVPDSIEVWKRITEVYGFTLSDVRSEYLIVLFEEIALRRNRH